LGTLSFDLPAELEAGEPPEARGLSRDQVRLMVSYRSGERVFHTQFRSLPDFLNPGDVVVINTSGTMNAALQARRSDGAALEVRLSTHLPGDLWVVEVRQPEGEGARSIYRAQPGERLSLNGGGWADLHTAFRPDQRLPGEQAPVRLWIASLHLPEPLQDYLDRFGFPIRYHYVKESWPLSYYQTVYTTERGSAEMPSAGRAFTPEIITRLIAREILVAPLILHTGVASLEAHEPPYEEFYRVPSTTARAVNAARAAGGRIIAVGTTVIRALETVSDEQGNVHPGEGWTGLVITPDRPVRAVDGLLTGLHEPESSHLAMPAALAGFDHLCLTYSQALQEGYRWHEFGDLHLILP
jgi:S-adenosylmethionine:tRNA ribosyltransferase-isomerase